MQIVLTIIALLIVLGVVVFVHELGHFLAARWAGVRVDTFSIGFGPAILKWHDKRGTVWKLACLPLGGYVSIYGQEDMFNRKKYAELSKEKKQGHYLSAPAWKQFIIIAAGVTMNFLLAWLIYTSLFMFQPRLVGNSQLPVIGQVIQESVAFNAGVRAGDTIVQIDDEKISKNVAECLYTGIIHDSGVFKYSSTTSHTMNIAGKLMDKGIDHTKLIDDGFYSKTYVQNQIL